MCKVLIVDDDKELVSSLKEMVESEGHSVTTCSNGADALEMQKKNPFDIIVTDIIMPSVDGLEVIFQVKKMFPETKIIAITGGGIFHTMDLLLMAKELGASLVLSKPFPFSMLNIHLKTLASI